MSTKSKKGGRPPTSFRDIMKITAKPLAEREALPVGKNGNKVVPRRYHLLPAEVKEMRQAFEVSGQGAIPNPYRGVYGAIVESLATSANEVVDFQSVKAEVKSLLSRPETRRGEGDEATTAWDRFAGKEARNEETGKDVDGRLLQNAEVLQRVGGKAVNQPGYKLFQVGKEVLKTKGMVIDILDLGDGKVGLRLNTDSDTPVNELRRARAGKPTAKADEPAKKGRSVKAKAPAAAGKAAHRKGKPAKPKAGKAGAGGKAEEPAPPPVPTPEAAQSPQAGEAAEAQ